MRLSSVECEPLKPAMSAIVRDITRSSILRIVRPSHDRIFGGILKLLVFLGAAAGRSAAQERAKKQATREEDLSLVRVNITTETRGPAEPLVINGKRIPDYQPKIRFHSGTGSTHSSPMLRTPFPTRGSRCPTSGSMRTGRGPSGGESMKLVIVVVFC